LTGQLQNLVGRLTESRLGSKPFTRLVDLAGRCMVAVPCLRAWSLCERADRIIEQWS
jgi:hypothetical protein